MNFAVALLLVLSVSAGAQLPSARRAPGFSLMDVMTLQQHDIQDYRGKIVLIDIMRTNCPHCQELTAALEQVSAKYGEKVQILSVVNPPDNQTTVRKYIADHKVKNPILYDCGQMAASYLRVGPNSRSISVPQLIVIDTNGLIRSVLSEAGGGGLGLKNILASIDLLLK